MSYKHATKIKLSSLISVLQRNAHCPANSDCIDLENKTDMHKVLTAKHLDLEPHEITMYGKKGDGAILPVNHLFFIGFKPICG